MNKIKTFQVESGSVRGFVRARHQGIAFRKLMKLTKSTKKDWGILARFREVIIGHGKKIFKVGGEDGIWKYQKPYYLFRT